LARVILGAKGARAAGDDLVVRVAAGALPGEELRARVDEATVLVALADDGLARRMARAIAAAVRRSLPAREAAPSVIRFRSRKRLAELAARPAALTGTVAVIRATEKNALYLRELVDGTRAHGVAGVQVVWDGRHPSRDRIERHVFGVLEHARATPRLAPVVLAASEEPRESLLILVAHRLRKDAVR
jgi:hypothetical protein